MLNLFYFQMNNKEGNEIRKFYRLLKKEFKPINDSIFLKIVLSSKKTDVRKKIKDLSLFAELQDNLIPVLESKGYIQRNPDKFHEFCITARGLWYYEAKRGYLDIEKALNTINEEHFIFIPKKKSLGNQDKVLLGSLFFCRFFSSECNLIFPKNNVMSALNRNWKDILVYTKEILVEIGAIDNKRLGFENKKDPLYLMRRQNNLPLLVHGLYVRSKGTHYLELSESNKNILNLEKTKTILNFLIPNGLNDIGKINFIEEQIKKFASNNRYKISNNRLFLDASTTIRLIEVIHQLYT